MGFPILTKFRDQVAVSASQLNDILEGLSYLKGRSNEAFVEIEKPIQPGIESGPIVSGFPIAIQFQGNSPFPVLVFWDGSAWRELLTTANQGLSEAEVGELIRSHALMPAAHHDKTPVASPVFTKALLDKLSAMPAITEIGTNLTLTEGGLLRGEAGGGTGSGIESGDTLPASPTAGTAFLLLQDDGANEAGMYECLVDGTWMRVDNPPGTYDEDELFNASVVFDNSGNFNSDKFFRAVTLSKSMADYDALVIFLHQQVSGNSRSMYGVVWTTDLLSGTRVTLNTKWYETAGRIIELASPETSKMIVGRSDDTTGLALALDSSGSQTYTVRIMGLNFRGEKGDPGGTGAQVVFAWKSATTAPAAPTTYSITAAGVVTGLDASWQASPPTPGSGQGLYFSAVSVPSAATYPVSTGLSWTTPVNLRGVAGEDGDDGATYTLTDDAVLDLAKTTRVTGDRGKPLGTSGSDENALALLDDIEPTIQTLTDGATISVNRDNGQVADVTLAGNRTLAVPTGGYDGAVLLVRVKQDSTGSRTLTLNSSIDRGDSDAPTLSTTGGDVDYLLFIRRGTAWDYLGIRKGYD